MGSSPNSNSVSLISPSFLNIANGTNLFLAVTIHEKDLFNKECLKWRDKIDATDIWTNIILLNRSNFQLLNTIYRHLSMHFCQQWTSICIMNFEKSIPIEVTSIFITVLMALFIWKIISSQFIIYWLDLYWSIDQNAFHFMSKQLFDHGFTFALLNPNLSCHITNIYIWCCMFTNRIGNNILERPSYKLSLAMMVTM